MMKRFAWQTSKVIVHNSHQRITSKIHGRPLLPRIRLSLQGNRPFWYSSTSVVLNYGEQVYQQALRAMERAKEVEKEEENERSKQMFEAWQKSQRAEHDPKTQGVVVVRTLVKQTRKSKKESKTDYMKKALDLLKEAADDFKHPMALVQLGNITLQDASKEEDPREMVLRAMDLFRQAGEAGYRVGWYNLGNLLWTGYPAVSNDEEAQDETIHQILAPDLHEAMDIFTKAIDLGDSDAMYLVGVHRMTAGGRENIFSGLKLIEKAVDHGHGGAMYYWALFHLNGEPTIGLEPCTLEEFAYNLDRAVEAGNTDALFTRGHSHYHGTEGYTQSYQKALEDFIQAAEEGHADAAGEFEQSD